MQSPATVPKDEKKKKSFIMSLFRYSTRANKVSQKPEPEVTPFAEKVSTLRKQQSCCDEEIFRRDGFVIDEHRRSITSSKEEEICKQSRKVVKDMGRRSVSQVETNLKSVVSFLQVKVMVTDMPGFMQVHAIKVARTSYDSLDKFSSRHIAFDIKKEFDRAYGPAWHCIVGSEFGSFVTHATGGFLYFSMDKLCILLFKTKVSKRTSH